MGLAGEVIRFKEGCLVSATRPGAPGAWRFDGRLEGWVAPAQANALAPEPLFRGRWEEGLRWPDCKLPPMRDYQAAAISAWVVRKRGVVVLPTGAGKTELAMEVIRQTGVATLVMAPTRALMQQWRRRIREALGVESGQLGDGRHDIRPITCATYHSASLRMRDLGDRYKLLVFDEAHHLPSPQFVDAARLSAAPWSLGLTATPERADGLDAQNADLIGPVCFRMEISDAPGSVVVDYKIVRVPVSLTASERSEYERLGELFCRHMAAAKNRNPKFDFKDFISRALGDPRAASALRAWSRRREIEDRAAEKLEALEDILALHPDTPAIIYVGSNEMGLDVASRFLVPPILTGIGKAEREQILARFSAGVYPRVVANRILDEGVNVPRAKIAVVLGGMASAGQAIQRLGRILRPCDAHTAVLYEVVASGTAEERRSQKRRRSRAYQGAGHRVR